MDIGGRKESEKPGYLWVSNVTLSARWYQQTLGMDHCTLCPGHEPNDYARLHRVDPDTWMGFLLMAPESYRHTNLKAHRDEIPRCVDRLCVVDIDRLFKEVEARTTVHTALRTDAGAVRCFAIEDPDGHLLVFNEWPRDHERLAGDLKGW